MLKLNRNQGLSACYKLDFASKYSSIRLKGDVWLEEEFIFRPRWFQFALLVGGSVNNMSRGTKLLLLPCLSTCLIRSSAGLSAWFCTFGICTV